MHGAVLARIGLRAAAPRPGIEGRENAADEGDDGQPVLPVIAQ
jgi:hypothetical protein